jgi:hypothetical protein
MPQVNCPTGGERMHAKSLWRHKKRRHTTPQPDQETTPTVAVAPLPLPSTVVVAPQTISDSLVSENPNNRGSDVPPPPPSLFPSASRLWPCKSIPPLPFVPNADLARLLGSSHGPINLETTNFNAPKQQHEKDKDNVEDVDDEDDDEEDEEDEEEHQQLLIRRPHP